ncbi:nitrate reductase [Cyberlindnera jadinii NRRL Y-1542]|uniref:Nitrate reductase n=1 Tax=Cyberlindnera jadinii (strain ATCC 18201 / CBS 1600 / BCRC 20928 / JCM 3617 / NBRC 0987 / NRRL Y-1542) TaxID=983966 RepID=A0A1E4RUC1_CYBJN|nr:nitrate reductase [Cyberlindnera jadinii NRRL Y-1542]ODV70877.1 nitrate reductase [Cyberlindnera jadinii NRRL Y-1542]
MAFSAASRSDEQIFSGRESSSSESEYDYDFFWRKDTPLTKILDIDTNTKDSHVARDERLLRLTGSHPFNCEPPLSLNYQQGFITPSHLHFVRNHGAVPVVDESEIMNWTFTVEGMVDNPLTLTLKDMIRDFPQYTTPITLCCAGNRRKEQNMVLKGKGFNWGASGVSTSLWTGCFLWDIISKANPSKKARYVWMEGGDDPAKGPYGTCVPLHMVRDTERMIMVAYKQNGEFLSPDHGKPLRCVLPGIIGGRSVKWLKRLVVSDVPSNNWYHYYDNKVLPTMVTNKMAAEEDHWWKDERYTIYDLNLQTITVYPENDERLIINETNESELYEIKGFGYNGGGKRIGRIEVSLDRGKTWTLCDIDYPEDRYREAGYVDLFGGTVNVCDRMSCLCWCFWSTKVEKKLFKSSKDIVVRGMDISMSAQPRNMYWNVTSMLNNWWYRVAIQPGDTADEVKFEHPCIANKAGGWMDRVKAQGGDILDRTWGEDDEDDSGPKVKKEVVDEDLEMMINPEKRDVIITAEELAKHANKEDPWFVVKGHVFTGTPFLDEHPGGVQAITNVAGEDATDDFIAIHSEGSKLLMKKFHIGRLETTAVSAPTDAVTEITPTLLNPKVWKKITLVKKEIISHDSRIFHFALESPEQTTGLPVGKHLFIRSKGPDGKLVMRAYTPKSNHKQKGILEILIKVYFPRGDIPGGKMTMILENMEMGTQIEAKGPTGEFEYLENGNFLYNEKPGRADSFLLLAGGSGITPCYQVIAEIVSQEKDNTKMKMFYANRALGDILCYEDLEGFKKFTNANLEIDYCLSETPEGWKGLTGYLNKELWDQYIEEQKKNGEFMVLVCGPPGMVGAIEKLVKESDLDPSRVVYF